jgi:prepilin-type N-terminal cleavage/methylation domain-containing protein
MKKVNTEQSGFTLIEILIAVVILAIISTLTATNISHGIKVKNKLENDIDDYTAARDALNIISHDINMAFHWIDIDSVLNAQAATGGTPPLGPNGQPVPQGSTPTPTPNANISGNQIPAEKLTSFVGETDSVYFTTLSHVRTLQNAQESDQAKVGYFIKEVKSTRDKKDTHALIRSESTVLDGEVKKNEKETVLLEDVKTFKLRYLGGDDKEWVENWKSVDVDDAVQKNKFPDAVEITITTLHNKREVTLSTMAAIHMTNNDTLSALSPTPGGAATGTVTPTATPH